jgi:chemotaxis protein methyltransferase CheR
MLVLESMEAELSDADFRRFSGLVYTASGIHLTEQKRELLRARLRKRLRALKLANYRDYFNVVTADGAEGELKALLDVVSTNKTEFFREARLLEHLRDKSAPGWLASASPSSVFRIWSAACSSGEEAWSLAMVMQEAFKERGEFKILGSDISTRMLDKALGGLYESRHVSSIPSAYFEQHMEPSWVEGQEAWRIKDSLRSKVAFARVNLNDASLPFENPMDVVFCRNVMIYFDKGTQEALVGRIHSLLRPGGWFYIGLSESLLSIRHQFETIAPSIYRKPL